eukprot:4208288-Heterocapsa_arctica.AAC.1
MENTQICTAGRSTHWKIDPQGHLESNGSPPSWKRSTSGRVSSRGNTERATKKRTSWPLWESRCMRSPKNWLRRSPSKTSSCRGYSQCSTTS